MIYEAHIKGVHQTQNIWKIIIKAIDTDEAWEKTEKYLKDNDMTLYKIDLIRDCPYLDVII